MRYVIWGALFVLLLLQQDYPRWADSPELVFGFLPTPLAYHMLISLVAGLLWFLATVFCWPKLVDETQAGLEQEEASA